MRPLLALLTLVFAMLTSSGCNVGTVTEADSERMKQEFSQENFEKNMKAMGKEKELQEAKAREEQYKAAGGQ